MSKLVIQKGTFIAIGYCYDALDFDACAVEDHAYKCSQIITIQQKTITVCNNQLMLIKSCIS